MNGNGLDFKPMLGEFGAKDPYVFLEKLEIKIERSQKNDLPHRILFTLLLPGALMVLMSIYNMARSQNQTGSFRDLVERSELLIGIATVAYFTMLAYLFPLTVILWDLFHQPDWGQFFSSLAQWATVQAIVLVLIQLYFAGLAVDSFKFTDTYHSRRSLLKRQAEAEHLKYVVALEVRNRMAETVPEIMKSLIDQTITAMVASGELNSNSAEEITRTMKQVARDIMLNPSNLESFPSNTSEIQNTSLELCEKESYGDY